MRPGAFLLVTVAVQGLQLGPPPRLRMTGMLRIRRLAASTSEPEPDDGFGSFAAQVSDIMEEKDGSSASTEQFLATTETFPVEPAAAIPSSTSSTAGDEDDDDALTTLSLPQLGSVWAFQGLFIPFSLLCGRLLHSPAFFRVPVGVDTAVATLVATAVLLAVNLSIDKIWDDPWRSKRFVQQFTLRFWGSTRRLPLVCVTAIITGLVAGFGEELLFRGVLQSAIAGKAGTIVGLILSSLLFGAAHAITPLYVAVATLSGAFFGGLFVRTGDVLVPALVHALYDAVAVVLTHLEVTKLPREEQRSLLQPLKKKE